MNRVLLFKGDEWGSEIYYSPEKKCAMVAYEFRPFKEYLFETCRDRFTKDESIDYEIMSWDQYIEYKEELLKAKYSKDWIETDADYFCEKLECLPPLKWTNNGEAERFLMSEYQEGSYTEHNIRIGEKYYCAIRKDSLSLADCLEEIKAK